MTTGYQIKNQQKLLCLHKRHKERILSELCAFIAHFVVNFIENDCIEPGFEHSKLAVRAKNITEEQKTKNKNYIP